ncbi:MAG: hypothetical protein EB038_00350 [Cyclobacteriaceae bacterium]|nr:hypothetical protein [Cyclobacteriaceae bacterium]
MLDQIAPEFSDQALVDYLGQYITQAKKRSIERVLAKRTRFFTLVLEDIFKPHNASAVLRTCDCFGIQDIHLIEKTDQYKINPFVTVIYKIYNFIIIGKVFFNIIEAWFCMKIIKRQEKANFSMGI